MSSRTLGLLTLAITLFSASLCFAGTVYSNFGIGYDHLPSTGYPVDSANYFGAEFTAAIGGSVSQIDVALTSISGSSNAEASLWTATSTDTPDTKIGSWTLTNFPSDFTCCDYASVTGITGVDLLAGDKYFLVIAGIGDAFFGWDQNSINDLGKYSHTTDGITWSAPVSYQLPAFDVIATDVPEPFSLLLFGSGLAGLLPVIRRKSH